MKIFTSGLIIRVNSLVFKCFLLFMLVLESYSLHSQTQFTMSIASVSATANTMDVTLTVTATNPNEGIRFAGFSAGINFNSATINGGTISATYLGGRSASLSGLAANAINVATAGHIRLATAQVSGASGVDIPQGTSLTLGTYRISNTANWTTSSNANLWLQNIVASGKTNSAVLGYPYGATTPSVSYTTTNPASPAGLILSHTSTSTFSAVLNAVASGPTASVLSGSATICAGSSTNLSVAVTGGVSPYTVTVTDGTNNYSATGASPVSIPVSPSATSTYSIVSVTGGGTGTGNTGSAIVTVTAVPAQPTLACYESATFNTTTCVWDVTGTQPVQPTGLSCWQTAAFNTTTCAWVTSGTQAAAPTGLSCWQTAAFNTTTCAWVTSGTQAEAPTGLSCWQTANFNTTTCAWDVTGTQPVQPTGLSCWQTAAFNTTTCAWVTSGTQETNTTIISASGSYTWANNGQTYTSSGTYSGNEVNCVAQVLNLTITSLVTATQFTMSIASVSATANTMDVTLTVTATNPSAGIRFAGFSSGINFNSAIINGGTISASYVGGRSASLSGLAANAISVSTLAGHIRLATAQVSGA